MIPLGEDFGLVGGRPIRSSLRIFFVCLRVPYPPDRGDKIATFNLIRYLAKRHQVHVFCLREGSADDANVAALSDHVQSVTAINRSDIAGKLRAVAAFATGAPLSVALINEPRLRNAVGAAGKRLKPDVVIAYSSNVAQFADDLGDVPRVMYFSDLDSQKWRQYSNRKLFPISWIYRREARLLLEYERENATRAARSIVCTAAEKGDFERLIPQVAVDVLANGVDLEHFRPSGQPKTPGMIVFTGVMNYFPNIDAVQWFCSTVLPIVRKTIPHATFVICGSRPVAAVRRLARQAGVVVTAAVPDVRPYLNAAEVCVTPLRIARGIQNKLLEGLAMGVPCVSSRCSWSGTVIPEGDGLLVADDPTTFAKHVIRLLQDERYRQEMGFKARAAVERSYRWDDRLRQLDQILQDLTGIGEYWTPHMDVGADYRVKPAGLRVIAAAGKP